MVNTWFFLRNTHILGNALSQHQNVSLKSISCASGSALLFILLATFISQMEAALEDMFEKPNTIPRSAADGNLQWKYQQAVCCLPRCRLVTLLWTKSVLRLCHAHSNASPWWRTTSIMLMQHGHGHSYKSLQWGQGVSMQCQQLCANLISPFGEVKGMSSSMKNGRLSLTTE